jgi:hypothetical protein
LGPTADYLGDELQHWTARRVENVQRIFSKAEKRLGAAAIDEPGGVPPRVLKEILDEGSYWDDELGAEYFGGILASSRTQDARDDRGAALAALVSRLSTYQLRCHYLFYSGAQRLMAGKSLNLSLDNERADHANIFMSWDAWLVGMDLEDETNYDRWIGIFEHCVLGLIREGLIEESYKSGSRKHLEQIEMRVFPAGGVIFRLSMLGVELFTAAHGLDRLPGDAFQSMGKEFVVDVPLVLGEEVENIDDLGRLS